MFLQIGMNDADHFPGEQGEALKIMNKQATRRNADIIREKLADYQNNKKKKNFLEKLTNKFSDSSSLWFLRIAYQFWHS